MALKDEDLVIYYKGEFRLLPAKLWQGVKALDATDRGPAEEMIDAGGIVGNIPSTSGDNQPGGYSMVVNAAAILANAGKGGAKKKKVGKTK
jgi:hypothetical protein